MSKDDILAAMYLDDEGEAPSPVPSSEAPARGIMNMPAMSAALRRMEQVIATQQQTIHKLQVQVRNMQSQMRSANKTTTSAINEIYSALDDKIDRRD